MQLPAPRATPYSAAQYQRGSWSERLRMAAQAWAIDGYGTPPAIFALYLLKVGLYVAAWVGFCALSQGSSEGHFLLSEDAFKRAVIWSVVFESLGLGCSSGPLSGRYMPPVAAPLHFARPGTLKLPLLPGLPILGRSERGWLDVGLYLAHLAFALRALTSPAITPELVAPSVVLLVLLGLSDKTIFLAARSEHYLALLVCFLFAEDWLAGAVAVQLAIWLWAAISKLNRHFPAVVCVMVSNSPVLRWAGLRRRMYRSFPDDLRPSRLAHAMAHAGTATELCFPLILLAGEGGVITAIGLVMMLAFHAFITSNVPMAVPIEWNVMVVYSAVFLFGLHPQVSPLDIGSPLLGALLIVSLVVVPLVGNLWPHRVSFLLSMRYYAGNWAYSIWLFEGDSADRLDAIPKAAGHPRDQLARFYDQDTVTTLMSKVPAFRAMHLHGRALHQLIPRAVDDIKQRDYADGEIIAGMVLGYNFGDGHLHDRRLLALVQERCGFASGELRHIYVESQPMLRPRLAWQIRDAKDGLLDEGTIEVDELLAAQPWPDEEPAGEPATGS